VYGVLQGAEACGIDHIVAILKVLLSWTPLTYWYARKGQKIEKDCCKSVCCCAQEVWDWVGSLEELDAVNFSLASSFPRQVFSGSSLAKSLSELGLAPQAALLVQVDDEE
jgi:hypothetical protein